MSTIGENIKKLRAEHDVTQKELAERLGLSFQAVSKWENEEVMPDILLLPEIAAFFEVSIDDLFKENIVTYASRAERLMAVYERTGKLEDFIKANYEAEKQLELTPGLELQRSYGVMYHYLARASYRKAEQVFDAVLQEEKCDQTYWRTIMQKNLLLSELGRGEESIEWLTNKLAEGKAVEKFTECLMAAYVNNQQYEKGKQLFEDALEKGMETACLHYLMGDACREQKEYEAAFSHWEKALELDADFMDALWSMAFCSQELGNKEQERAAWERIIAWQKAKGLVEENVVPKKMLAALVEE